MKQDAREEFRLESELKINFDGYIKDIQKTDSRYTKTRFFVDAIVKALQKAKRL